MNTYEHPVKCLDCSLHFVVLSQYPDWPGKAERFGGPFCPECGKAGNKLVWMPREKNEFIFQIVPGAQPFRGHVGG